MATKRTLAQTDTIVKSCAETMENAAARLERVARAMESILGRSPAALRVLEEANNLRSKARTTLGKIK